MGMPEVGTGGRSEFEYDGVRAVSYVERGRVRVLSRNGKDVTATYFGALAGQ
ncbi:hypothetical protein [Actinoplanes aureus]|uniref:Uncharacterized protein n=1 Tax=Actinoplanes aureus TaxID=2792083 RepID=A0A931CJ12_9ACTN|nr:hypothetical protein [Actinoplanes aureus]MBG0568011.1 hypothetical protein [Actinoplanes aureus]